MSGAGGSGEPPLPQSSSKKIDDVLHFAHAQHKNATKKYHRTKRNRNQQLA